VTRVAQIAQVERGERAFFITDEEDTAGEGPRCSEGRTDITVLCAAAEPAGDVAKPSDIRGQVRLVAAVTAFSHVRIICSLPVGP
jgi:hypothetical protein